MEFFATSASKIMDCPDWESVASAHPALVNEALRAMARRHSSDANETPKKKIKFSP
jgi:transposase